jgi:hypothetical protein
MLPTRNLLVAVTSTGLTLSSDPVLYWGSLWPPLLMPKTALKTSVSNKSYLKALMLAHTITFIADKLITIPGIDPSDQHILDKLKSRLNYVATRVTSYAKENLT